jgi:hypothetical protein
VGQVGLNPKPKLGYPPTWGNIIHVFEYLEGV